MGTNIGPELTAILIALALWVLPWKGWSLWTAAKSGHKWWFIILLVTNTLAILDIIYLGFVAKKLRFKKEQE